MADLINFTIDGISYQAEEGMTWSDWLHSSYNVGEFRHGVCVSDANSAIVANADGTPVDSSDVIIANYAYITTGLGFWAGRPGVNGPLWYVESSAGGYAAEYDYEVGGKSYRGFAMDGEDDDYTGAIRALYNGVWVPELQIIKVTYIPTHTSLSYISTYFDYIGEEIPKQFLDEQGLRTLATHTKAYIDSHTIYRVTEAAVDGDDFNFTIVSETGGEQVMLTVNDTVDAETDSKSAVGTSYSSHETKESALSSTSNPLSVSIQTTIDFKELAKEFDAIKKDMAGGTV